MLTMDKFSKFGKQFRLDHKQFFPKFWKNGKVCHKQIFEISQNIQIKIKEFFVNFGKTFSTMAKFLKFGKKIQIRAKLIFYQFLKKIKFEFFVKFSKIFIFYP